MQDWDLALFILMLTGSRIPLFGTLTGVMIIKVRVVALHFLVFSSSAPAGLNVDLITFGVQRTPHIV